MAKKAWLFFIIVLLAACTTPQQNNTTQAGIMKFPYNRPLNIAHRGARSVAPENTLLAAQKGYELHADLWELDVAMTSDAELVVLHDETLKRTSNAKQLFPKQSPWNVDAFTLAELRTLDFGSWYVQTDPFGQIKAGVVSAGEQQTMQNTPIPTLREALLYTKENNWQVNVELKDLSGTPGDADVVERTVALIQELDMVEQVIISSFNHSYLVRVKQADPNLKTAALIEKMVADPLKLLQDLDAQALNPSHKILGDLSVIRTLRDAGYDVNVWTVNDADLMIKLINAGASGIITDYPQVMNEVMKAYE
ncbi:MAG: glycerophosphodiester phosphodiesterase [Chloroflexi bacterium HGW-Chloroflexi-10]|nr:MAG: glycerophosphodiester phosphodiesterase [Chloroflexi bacterium HGW-Chloroflexi-10]